MISTPEICQAFLQLRGVKLTVPHPDYVVTDDAGEKHAIFDKNTHLRLEQPATTKRCFRSSRTSGPSLTTVATS